MRNKDLALSYTISSSQERLFREIPFAIDSKPLRRPDAVVMPPQDPSSSTFNAHPPSPTIDTTLCVVNTATAVDDLEIDSVVDSLHDTLVQPAAVVVPSPPESQEGPQEAFNAQHPLPTVDHHIGTSQCVDNSIATGYREKEVIELCDSSDDEVEIIAENRETRFVLVEPTTESGDHRPCCGEASRKQARDDRTMRVLPSSLRDQKGNKSLAFDVLKALGNRDKDDDLHGLDLYEAYLKIV